MQTYETLFVTTPTLSEDEERTIVEGLAQVVTDGGGTFTTNERMGRRRLAYPIEKHVDGVYVRFLYDSDMAVPKELERRLRLSDKILRMLTVCLEPKWAVASKEQALRDIQARAEAAEREKQEQLEKEAAEQKALEEAAAAPPPAETEVADAPETPATEAAGEPEQKPGSATDGE